MRDSVAAAAASGMPILAECGGYLYLLDSLEGADGTVYPMAGVLKGRGYRAGKTGRFGYITLEPNRCLPYLQEGEEIKGHEFHYWDCDCGEDEFCMTAVKPKGGRSWPCMRTEKQVMAGFPHLYYPSCPDWSGGLPDSAWNTDRAMAGSMTDRAMAGSMTDKNMTERNMSYDIEGSDEEH